MHFEFVGHKRIKMFQVDGQIDSDNNIPKTRIKYESMMVDMMRSKGYVPHLDLEPAFSLKYNEEKKYEFLLSMYGVYVGRSRARCHHGVVANRLIPVSSTQKDK